MRKILGKRYHCEIYLTAINLDTDGLLGLIRRLLISILGVGVAPKPELLRETFSGDMNEPTAGELVESPINRV